MTPYESTTEVTYLMILHGLNGYWDARKFLDQIKLIRKISEIEKMYFNEDQLETIIELATDLTIKQIESITEEPEVEYIPEKSTIEIIIKPPYEELLDLNDPDREVKIEEAVKVGSEILSALSAFDRLSLIHI